MAELDALGLAQLAIKVGLVTEIQVQEVWEDLGQRGGDAEPFLRAIERKGFLTTYQSGKLLKGDFDGYFLGGYRLLYKIASGSFGRVFRADDPRTGTVVAIKVLRQRWMDKPHTIELFEREGKVGMSLRHPNIVEIINVSRDPSTKQYFIVMEFVEGGNLRDILAIRGKFQPAEALRLIEDAAKGLSYAYSRGVTHRDMKLSNILISSQGEAKLVDFGLAGIYRSLKPDEESQVDRTVDYAGLERATNVSAGDVRSDIYFLGCVLYEVLTGRSPLLMTRNKMARMQKERFSNVEPMGKAEVAGPPSVFRLVETMMSLNAQQRFQTPSQLLDAIQKVRREVEGAAGQDGKAALPRSLFIVEKDERLQDALREKFKGLGYKVLLAADPVRALDRFRQQAFDGLVVDAGTTGEDGLMVFERIMAEAERHGGSCGGILVLSEEQAGWVAKVKPRPTAVVMVRPVTLKQLHHKMQELVAPRT
jgi:CheY-like chemotaxis protein